MPTKILIIDDSETARLLTKEALKKGNYDIIEAQDGMTGLSTLDDNPDTDLIIADINMPWMDGLQMTEEIRKKEEVKNIPIILVTTESSQDQIERGKALSVAGWIVKPFNAEDLIAAVNKVLKKAKKSRSR